MTLNIAKLAARLSEERDASEKFFIKLRQEGAKHAEFWLMGAEVDGLPIDPAPFEIIKAVAHLPIRKYDYRGRPRDGGWTNEDWADLCCIDIEDIKIGLFEDYEGVNIDFEITGEEELVITNLDELLEKFGGWEQPLNQYVAGFVGRVRSVWNDIAEGL